VVPVALTQSLLRVARRSLQVLTGLALMAAMLVVGGQSATAGSAPTGATRAAVGVPVGANGGDIITCPCAPPPDMVDDRSASVAESSGPAELSGDRTAPAAVVAVAGDESERSATTRPARSVRPHGVASGAVVGQRAPPRA
jgi:hypothetical protein